MKKHKKSKEETKILKLLKNEMIPLRLTKQEQKYEFFKSRKNH